MTDAENSTVSNGGGSSKSKVLVVFGATGNQGGAVLRYFARQNSQLGFHLRGITRNPSSEKSQLLISKGVEMIQADLNDVGSIRRALDGATHIFATTDSNQYIFEAIRCPEKLESGQSAVEYGCAIELAHGKNIIEAARAVPTLKIIIYSSLPSPKKWSEGRYSAVTNFDTKDMIAELMNEDETLHDKLGILVLGFYADNTVYAPTLYGPTKNPTTGIYELQLPISNDTIVPFADLEVDLGNWVHMLFEHIAPGLSLLGVSEYLSWGQWLDLWGQRNNVPVKFIKGPPGGITQESESFNAAITEEFQFIEDFGFLGGDRFVFDPDHYRAWGAEMKTSSIKAHINRTDWSFALKE